MAESDLFEEMLAAYPAEKRELARVVYYRFADGDSTQFFSQLFLVLDVYAHYAERIPTRMISANADTLATIEEMRGEVAHIAKTIETRDANITSHAEKTDELCRITLAKCNETIAAIELTVKNLGAQVDTQAIVQGVQNSIQSGINQKIIAPFVQHTNDLAWKVMPTLEKIQDAADEAKSEWSKRIWKTAWTTSLFWSIGAAILIACLICSELTARYDRKAASRSRHSKYHEAHLRGDISQAEAARELGMKENAFKVAHHRFRERLARDLWDEVSKLVGPDEAEVRAEIAYLMSLFAEG